MIWVESVRWRVVLRGMWYSDRLDERGSCLSRWVGKVGEVMGVLCVLERVVRVEIRVGSIVVCLGWG